VSTRAILVGGIVASLVIAMWQMIVEAVIADGAGLFGPPIAIGATIIRDLQGSPNPIPFDLAALVIGLAGHMMNSVVLAAVFGIAVGRRGLGTSRLMVAGVGWGVIVFAATWLVVLPIVDPVMLNLNAAAFLAGHAMWGAALGFLWARLGDADRVTSLSPA